VKIYRQRPVDPLVIFIVALMVCAYLKFEPHPLVEAVLSFVAVDGLLSLHRAVILTNDAVIYRPPIGDSISILLTNIRSIEECRTISGGTVIQGRAHGVSIGMSSATEVFPLTIQNASELLGYLRNVAITNTSKGLSITS